MTTTYLEPVSRDVYNSISRTLSETRTNIGKAETYVKQLLDNGDIEPEAFFGLAKIFDWETTREIDVKVTVEYTGTVVVPIGTDVDYIDEFFDCGDLDVTSPLTGEFDFDSLIVEVR